MLDVIKPITRINTTITIEIENADEVRRLMDRQNELLFALRDNVDALCAVRLRLVGNAQPPAGTDGRDGRDQSDYVISTSEVTDASADHLVEKYKQLREIDGPTR